MNKGDASNDAKTNINSVDWYVPTYTLGLSQQNILHNQIVKKMATELQYIERSLFMREVNTQNLWTFELGTHEGINVPIWIFVVFQQSDRQHDQNINNGTFYRHPVTSAQCIIGTEKYPDVGSLSNYADDNYSHGYHQIKETFRTLTKDDIL